MEILEIGLVGVLISLLVSGLRKRFGTSDSTTQLIAVGVSVVLGAAYYFLSGTGIWNSILGVLAASQTFFTFVMDRIQTSNKTETAEVR